MWSVVEDSVRGASAGGSQVMGVAWECCPSGGFLEEVTLKLRSHRMGGAPSSSGSTGGFVFVLI